MSLGRKTQARRSLAQAGALGGAGRARVQGARWCRLGAHAGRVRGARRRRPGRSAAQAGRACGALTRLKRPDHNGAKICAGSERAVLGLEACFLAGTASHALFGIDRRSSLLVALDGAILARAHPVAALAPLPCRPGQTPFGNDFGNTEQNGFPIWRKLERTCRASGDAAWRTASRGAEVAPVPTEIGNGQARSDDALAQRLRSQNAPRT